MSRVTLILVMMACSQMVAGAVYKWTDEHGRVQFSDRPEDARSEQVEVAPSPKSIQPPLGQAERERKRRRLLDVYREDRAKKQANSEKRRQAKVEKKQQCLKAQQRYARFNHAGGIYETDEHGERHYMDRDMRARYIAKLQAEVDRWCAK